MSFSAGQFVQVNTPSGVNVRSTPDIPNAPATNIFATVPNGAVLQVIGDSQQGWTNVLWGGKPGWVSEQFMLGVQPAQVPTGTYEVTGSNVNIRTDPSLSAPVITETGPVGDTVESVGLAINQYMAVAYKGQQGYISTAYVKQPGQAGPLARTLPNQPPVVAPNQPNPNPPAVTPVANTPPKPGGIALAGGLLALALVLYFVAK